MPISTDRKRHGYLATGGQIVDATIVPVARDRSRRERNSLEEDADTTRDVRAESAYRSAETGAKLVRRPFFSRVHWRGARSTSLTKGEKASNGVRSKIRARVEHASGHQVTAMGEANQGSDA